MHTDVQPNAGRGESMQFLASEIQARRLHTFLKGRRDHLGLPQEAIAARLDISGRAYGDWERGRVKEWKDEKLYALAEALEMTEYQITLLFLYAVGRAPQPDVCAALHPPEPQDRAAALLGDYAVLLDALSLPSFVIDHAWDVQMANKAFRDLFSGVPPHPTAMPTRNFLRFGLFHPDAPFIFVDHLKWQLAMLAQLSSSLERHSEDTGLQAIRRDVYRHAALRDAYLTDMPNWVLGTGADLVHHEGAVRELRHPDPDVGRQGCRLVEESPRSLQRLGFTRLTLVLIDLDERLTPGNCASADRHAA
ncbi:helix-turn-helix domain-containing protein [Streptomyces sp. 372A]